MAAAHEKENPHTFYAAGSRAESALLVRGSSRRIMTLRFRPAYIRVIQRRDSLCHLLFLRSKAEGPPFREALRLKQKTRMFASAIDRSFHIRTPCGRRGSAALARLV